MLKIAYLFSLLDCRAALRFGLENRPSGLSSSMAPAHPKSHRGRRAAGRSNSAATSLVDVTSSEIARGDGMRRFGFWWVHFMLFIWDARSSFQRYNRLTYVSVTLLKVTKTMASKRLAMDRKVFHELSAHIFPLILSLWTHSISNLYRLIETPNAPGMNW